MGIGEKLSIQKLRLEISAVEAQKTSDFASLGRYYFSIIRNGEIPVQVQPFVSALNAKDAQIAEKNEKIEELERIIEAQQSVAEGYGSYSDGTKGQTAEFCTQCGKRLEDGMSFCPGCGARVKKGSN